MPSLAPANYYAINSAIFIEDAQNQNNQMIVMNDRTQGGSGFRNGHIELMFDRRTFTDDQLGNQEHLDEKNPDGSPRRSHNRYFLAFTSSRLQAFSVITKRSLLTQNPLQIYSSMAMLSSISSSSLYSRT